MAAGSATTAPILNLTGKPSVTSTDLASEAFGVPFSITRSWAGMNNTSSFGNGWAISSLPYLVVQRNEYAEYGGGHSGMINVVVGGTAIETFFNDSNLTDLTPRYTTNLHLRYIAPTVSGSTNIPGYFEMRDDSDGSIYTFNDVPRQQDTPYPDENGDIYGRIYAQGNYTLQTARTWYDTTTGDEGLTTTPYVFGSLVSWTDSSKTLHLTNSYTFGSGDVITGQDVYRTDGSGTFERFSFTFSAISNSQTGGATRQVTEARLRRGSGTSGSYDPSTVGSGSWSTVRSAEYDYYTGVTTTTDASNGRLGDLKTVTIRDFQYNPSGDVIDQKYYQYYKFHGLKTYVNSSNSGPSNIVSANNDSASGSLGTGGTDTTFPLVGEDNSVSSGLKVVVEGEAFSRLTANVSSYTTASIQTISEYAQHVFWYRKGSANEFAATDQNFTEYRVIQETATGQGCSMCSGGTGTFRYSYESGGKADYFEGTPGTDTNRWIVKGIEYLPDTTNADLNNDGLVDSDQWLDNDQSIVYVNELGQTMLSLLRVRSYATVNSLVSATMSENAYWAPDTFTFSSPGHQFKVGDKLLLTGAMGGYGFTSNDPWTVTAASGSNFTVVGWEVEQNTWDPPADGLSVLRNADSITAYNRYDARGNIVLTATPSALAGFSESFDDLINYPTSVSHGDPLDDGIGSFGKYGQGMITRFVYAPSTTGGLGDGDSLLDTRGDVKGYLSGIFVTQGFHGAESSSAWTPLTSIKYYAHTVGGATVYPVASHLQHWDADGNGTLASTEGSLTQYTYTYFVDSSANNTNRIASITTTLPAVSASHNGSGTSDVTTIVYDAKGRPVWTKDQDGFIHYVSYDAESGAVNKTITDVNLSQTSTFANAPSGWATRAGGGLHLTTLYEVDDLGRTTKVTDAGGRVNLTRYDDFNHAIVYYPGWHEVTTGTWAATGAISIIRTYRPTASATVSDGRLVFSESLSLLGRTFTSSDPSARNTLESSTYSASTISSLTRQITNNAGQITEIDTYFALGTNTYSFASSNAHIGTLANTTLYAGGTYHAQWLAYDSRGQLKRTEDSTNPSTALGDQGHGTITRYLYDVRQLLTEIWVGTDDTPTSGYWSPDNNSGANMVRIQLNSYDVDRNLVNTFSAITSPSGTVAATGRTTLNWYDWRNRLVARKIAAAVDLNGAHDPGSEDGGTQRLLTTYTYDNLNNVTAARQYDGDGVTITMTGGLLTGVDPSKLRAYSTNEYDDLGRFFRSKTFAVDPSSGNFYSGSIYLESSSWYDARGNTAKTLSPGGLVTKYAHDGAGRTTTIFSTDGGGDPASGTSNTYSNALTLTGDSVLEQTEYTYDGSSNVVLTTLRQRFHNETATDRLTDIDGTIPSGTGTYTGAKARVSYTAAFYDGANRITDNLNVGTNGGSAYSRPSTPPGTSTATGLLTHYSYDIVGTNAAHDYRGLFASEVTDPAGIKSRTYVDMDGRTRWTVEAYNGGNQTSSTNRATNYDFDGAGHAISMKAYTDTIHYQQTSYLYGVDPSKGSSIASFNLLYEIRYPDLTTTNTSSSSISEKFYYDAEGQKKGFVDRNGTVHFYSYDGMGRLFADRLGTVGTGVDDTVRAIVFRYDSAGRLQYAETYSSSTTNNFTGTYRLSQVARTYNGFGQVISEVQPGGTVSYTYSTPSTSLNASRITGMTYGPEYVVYVYDSGVDSRISRLSGIESRKFAESSYYNDTRVEGYAYLGLSTIIQRQNREIGSSSYSGTTTYAGLTLARLGGETWVGDGGDIYTGLDRFGRVVDQRWVDKNGSNADQSIYVYDFNSNPLSKQDGLSRGLSEVYKYDSLNRLVDFARGTITYSGSPEIEPGYETETRGWDLDALGNWEASDVNGISISRDHNALNQIVSIDTDSLQYDANGNQTVDEDGVSLVYDAWNRLVSWDDGSTVIAFLYDGLGRRASRNDGSATLTFRYSTSWQVLTESNSLTGEIEAYIWSAAYVDGMVLKDTYQSTNLYDPSARSYARQDANWNVTSITSGYDSSPYPVYWGSGSGQASARFIYDPYGNDVTIVDIGSWSGGGWHHFHQGGSLDSVTGLMNFRFRDYDPDQGRWTSPDPLGYMASTNPYDFISSSPLRDTDPTGLIPGLIPDLRGAAPNSTFNALWGSLSKPQQGCSDCLKDAVYLSNAIDSALANANPQIGGAIGNYISGLTGGIAGLFNGKGWDQGAIEGGIGNQCGDWQVVMDNAISKYLKNRPNSCFAARALNGASSADPDKSNHNWVEIQGGAGTVTIDPWPSGGMWAVDDSFTGQYYKDPSRTITGDEPLDGSGPIGRVPCECPGADGPPGRGGPSGPDTRPKPPSLPRPGYSESGNLVT